MHVQEKANSLLQKHEFSTNFYSLRGPTDTEEDPWLFNISVNMDMLKLVISSEPFFEFAQL